MFRSLKTKASSAILILAFLCILPNLVAAQPPIDPGNGGCFGSDPMDECPIDGGVGALLVLGVGYGVKKIRDARLITETKIQ
jgi:hypothetical protein